MRIQEWSGRVILIVTIALVGFVLARSGFKRGPLSASTLPDLNVSGLADPGQGIMADHAYGKTLEDKGEVIPDEWFGDTENARVFSRARWRESANKDWADLIHFYALESKGVVVVLVGEDYQGDPQMDCHKLMSSASQAFPQWPETHVLLMKSVKDGPHELIASMEKWNSLGLMRYICPKENANRVSKLSTLLGQ